MKYNYDEKLALLKINAFGYFRTDWFTRLLEIYGTAQDILKQPAESLAAEGKISLQTAKKFLEAAATLNAEREVELTDKAGGKIIFYGEDNYPIMLQNIKEPPLALYVRGCLPAGDDVPAVAVVGTRKITPYGKRAAAFLCEDLAKAGVVLVSGLARGVDSIVHASAVRNQKPTWAVIGTGIGRCYPAENRDLALGILDNGGAIVSELPFEAPPLAQHFPRRNRILAGLAHTVVVVEGEVKSGALITAKMALEQGKEPLAVPGPIDSPQSGGTNQLIREGSPIISSAKDIIDVLPLNLKTQLNTRAIYNKEDAPVQADLSPKEQQVLEAVGEGVKSVDDIAIACDMEIAELSGLLFTLEVNGVLSCQNGRYERSKLN